MTAVDLRVVITVLVLASSASIMSTDLYTPSLPHLPAYFGTTAPAVKLTVTLNLLAFGLAQLVLGPLSDRFGRRPVMLTGIACFTVFSVGCAVADSIEALIAARVLQGIAASVEAVVGLAIIRDLFSETDRVRALAIWGMAIAITPAAAPVLGGYVYVALGWRANFWLVAAVGLLVAVLIWRVLPESVQPDRSALRPARVARGYWRVLRDRTFTRYAVLLGTGLGAIFAFVTAGPFILITGFGVPTERFGLYQAAIVAAFFVGSLLTSRLADRVPLDRLLGVGLLTSSLGALGLPVLLLGGWLGPVSLTAAMSVLAFGLGPVFAIGPSRALDVAPANVGIASALIGSSQMILSGLAAGCVTVFHDGTGRPMVYTVLGLLVLAGLGWWLTGSEQRPPRGRRNP